MRMTPRLTVLIRKIDNWSHLEEKRDYDRVLKFLTTFRQNRAMQDYCRVEMKNCFKVKSDIREALENGVTPI